MSLTAQRSGPASLLTESGETATVGTPETTPAPAAPVSGGVPWLGVFLLLSIAFAAAFVYRRYRWISKPAEDRAFIRLASAAGFDRRARSDFEASARRNGVAPLRAAIERAPSPGRAHR